MALMMSSAVLAEGKVLHDKSCLQCHASISAGEANELYTRADRKVTNFPALQKQVRNCAVAADANWSDKQREW